MCFCAQSVPSAQIDFVHFAGSEICAEGTLTRQIHQNDGMALNAKIFKFALNVADLDRHYYADHALVVARHPSETNERMMVRMLAFAMHASETLEFGRGISTDDEPTLWDKDLTGQIDLWIDVGLPDERIVRRACGRARNVIVYAYGGRAADMWWTANEKGLSRNDNLTVKRVSYETSKALATMADRTATTLQCTIQDGSVWMDDGKERVEAVFT